MLLNSVVSYWDVFDLKRFNLAKLGILIKMDLPTA